MASQMRAEIPLASPAPTASRPRPPPPARPREESPEPVLSYICTCIAVAEYLGVPQEEVESIARESSDFKSNFEREPEAWDWIVKRSLAIEKERREEQKDAERRKMQ